MKSLRLILASLALLAMLIPPALAADGIPANRKLDGLLYQVDGKDVPATDLFAIVTVDSSGVATLRVTFHTEAGMGETYYTLTRKDGPGPDPNPNPQPDPKPAPTPTTLWVTVIEETAQRTPAIAAVIGSKAVADAIQAKSHHWRVADKDAKNERGEVPADLAGHIQRSAGKLPYLIITDSSAKILYEGKLTDEAATLALIKKHGG